MKLFRILLSIILLSLTSQTASASVNVPVQLPASNYTNLTYVDNNFSSHPQLPPGDANTYLNYTDFPNSRVEWNVTVALYYNKSNNFVPEILLYNYNTANYELVATYTGSVANTEFWLNYTVTDPKYFPLRVGARNYHFSTALHANLTEIQAWATNATVGNWTFDQGTGNYANDSSGFNLNGTLDGSPAWSTNLINGSVNSTSLQFIDVASTVNISNATGLSPEYLNFTYSTPYTIDFWYKPNNTIQSGTFISKRDAAGNTPGWEIFNSGGTFAWFVMRTDGVNQITVTSTNAVFTSANKWYHVTAVYDGSSSGAGASLYVNDANIPLTVGANAPGGEPRNNAYAFIGSRSNTTSFINATIDEMKIYNYALNSSERTAVYQQFHPVPAYPVGGITISPSSSTTYVNLSWHDTVYPQDELTIATDLGFTNVVQDAFYSTDYANQSLTVNTQYYWRVRQFDSGTGTYGNTSAIQTFTIGTVPTFIRVNVFDELNLSAVPNINVTLVSIPTNTSVNLSSIGVQNFVNFTNPSITDGVQYLAQVSAMGYTTRNILISAPGNYSVYLPYTSTSAGVSQVKFVLSDYTGLFPFSSTKLIIRKVINTTLVNISSDYFDAVGASTTQLINGQQYQLVVESSQSVRSLGNYIPTASTTETLVVGAFSVISDAAFNGLVYNFTYNSNQSIILQWSDPNNEIISLNETITNELGTIVLQLITSVHSGQTTYLIANTSSKYLVELNISTVNYGYLIYRNWYNPALFSSASSSVAPTPGLNNYIIPFGNTTTMSNTSNANAPIPQWIKNFISVGFLVVMALLFNREHVLRGAVVVSLFSLIFWVTGFLVFDIGYVTTGAILGMGFIISIIALLAESNKG